MSPRDAETEIDPQDPLPEPTWVWRRLYVYAVTLVFLALIWIGVQRLAEAALMEPRQGISALLRALQWMIAALVCVVTYYLVAPSAEQIVKIIQAARLHRSKVDAVKEVSVKHEEVKKAEVREQGGDTRREPPENAPWA